MITSIFLHSLSHACFKMLKLFYLLLITLVDLGKANVQKMAKREFDLISNYKIVRTKIKERAKAWIEIDLIESNDGTVVFSLSLIKDEADSHILNRKITSFQVVNDSGTYEIPNTIIYYHGHVNSIDGDSYVHGTLYHDLAFEGVIGFHNETFYLEAVDRHKAWQRNMSVLYCEDDVKNIVKDRVYSAKANLTSDVPLYPLSSLYKEYHKFVNKRHEAHIRRKREGITEYRFCEAHILVDGYFVHYMAGGNILEAAKIITQTINTVHQIYTQTDFDGDDEADQVGVVMASLTFIDRVRGYNYLAEKLDVGTFLHTFGSRHWTEGSCITLGFTYQDFQPTLGLAYLASNGRIPIGGLGERRNHGIITSLLGEKRLPILSMQLVVAHEIGHLFGSRHDPNVTGGECSPGSIHGGKYIMYPHPTHGYNPNNYVFSTCSRDQIGQTLFWRSERVLKYYEGAYCGNAYVEEGEECDCGTEQSCSSLDQCCTPAGQNNECLLRKDLNADCSPAVHACCTSDCKVFAAEDDQICGSDNECMELSYCNGVSRECPMPVERRNNSLCRGNTRVCTGGQCKGSVCKLAALDDCYCTSGYEACKLCCMNLSSEVPVCQPATSYTWFSSHNISVAKWQESGSLCHNETGFCDTSHICRDSSYDFVTLLNKNLLSEWFDVHWYALMVILFLLLVLFVMYSCSQEKVRTSTYDTFKYGHTLRLKQECERQDGRIKEQMRYLEEAATMYEYGRIDFATAFARLILLFPLTALEHLHEVMVRSASEAGAVKYLLLMKQPIATDVTAHSTLKSQRREFKTEGKINEQFQGELIATVDQLMQMTVLERAQLGIVDPTDAEQRDMLVLHQKKFIRKLNKNYNQPH